MSQRLHRLAEARSLAIHREIAAKLRAHPEAVRLARERVAEWRSSRSVAAPYVEAWDALLCGPLEDLLNTLCDPGERATTLRQVSPFAGFIPPRERWRIWRDVREASGL